MPGNFYNITATDVSHWPPSNYVDPPDRQWLPPFAIAWLIISTIFVWGRMSLRLQRRSGPFGLDDAFIIAGWTFGVAFTVTACIAVWRFEIGRHVWDMRPELYSGALYNSWVAQVMFLWSTGATKLSVLLFYRRIVKDIYSRGWIYTVWILMFITTGSMIGIFIAYVKICTPLKAYWDFPAYNNEGTGPSHWTCVDGDALTIATSVITIASDFWTAALPCAMFQIYNIGISRRQKIAMNVIFCLGLLVTGVGIARTYYLWKIGHNEDLSWVGYDLFVASIVEIQLAIACTCAPFLRAFFRRYFPDLVSSTTGRGASPTLATIERGSFNVALRPVHTPDLSDRKTGVLIRETTTGLFKPLWFDRHVAELPG